MDEAEIEAVDETPEVATETTTETVDAEAEELGLKVEGEEAPESPTGDETKEAPEWVRELRKQNRELKKQLKEREAAAPKVVDTTPLPGEKPTLESCDFDATAFADKLEAWHETKRKADDAAAQARRAQEAEAATWNAKVEGHNGRVQELAARVPKAAEYVAEADAALTPMQRGHIVHVSPESHRVLAVLGKNPALLEEVSAIKDHALFLRRIVEIELSLTGKTKKPAPERTLSGGAGGGSRGSVPGNDATLERLEAEADRTGDRTKLVRYRRDLAAAKKAA